ncbi:conserved domain protein [Streptococcus oralis SK255]|uniref:Conserved domain protein n=1 Tax=Streptococcus oralis SK255 TaxID=1005704 RepID=F5VWN0_STROR|nr:conserved domain protein [Streptococcus oralis SK255]
MNDKVKLFVLAGVILLAISGFYFLLMRNAGQTDSSQIEKASVSQGGKTVKKQRLAKTQTCTKFI